MRRFFHGKKAQMFSEYSMAFFLVSAAIISMTVFVSRLIQARIFDAKTHMIETVRTAPLASNLNYEYEPYYTQTDSKAYRDASEEVSLSGGILGQTGTFKKTFDDSTKVLGNNIQLPPAFAQ